MNNGLMNLGSVRVVSAPEVRMAGDRELVSLRVALNTYGEKAKARYREAVFIGLTFSGRDGEQAKALLPGDAIGCHGKLGVRDYTDKNGVERMELEIPFAADLIIHSRKAERAAPAADAPKAAPAKPAAKPAAKPPADDPFAGL